jgi:hypothetical protein
MGATPPILRHPAAWFYYAFGVLEGALAVESFVWGSAIVGFNATVFAGIFLIWPYTRRIVYHTGWLAGRRALFLSLPEARRRGLSVQEWVYAEWERDMMEIVSRERGRDEGNKDRRVVRRLLRQRRNASPGPNHPAATRRGEGPTENA